MPTGARTKLGELVHTSHSQDGVWWSKIEGEFLDEIRHQTAVKAEQLTE